MATRAVRRARAVNPVTGLVTATDAVVAPSNDPLMRSIERAADRAEYEVLMEDFRTAPFIADEEVMAA